MIKQAIILAAGEGKRLRPFTETMPKVMLPVANKPIIEHVIEAVKQSGISEIIIVVGYKKEVIMEYFKDYKDIKIVYVNQDKQLGTSHALLQVEKFLDKNFIVLSGDNIINYRSILQLIDDKSDLSILIKEHPHPSKYGVVSIENKFLKQIIEKPEEKIDRFISTGIYKLNKTVIKQIKELAELGIYDLTSVIQSLIKNKISISTIITDSWTDIVYPWDLLSVNENMSREINKSTAGLIEKGVVIKGAVSIEKDTKIYSGSYIVGPVIIGKGCEIGPNACIFPSSAIGNNSVIGSFSEIRNCVIMNDVHIGSNNNLSNSIIGKGCNINNNFSTISGDTTIEIENEFTKISNIGVMIGEDCEIHGNAVAQPGVIIGRKCKIDPLKHIYKNIPSGTKVM